MSERRILRWQTIARWLVGGVLIAMGVGWLALMLWDFALMQLHMVASWDVALTFWYPVACVTFPLAVVAIVAGVVLARGRRRIADALT